MATKKNNSLLWARIEGVLFLLIAVFEIASGSTFKNLINTGLTIILLIAGAFMLIYKAERFNKK